MTTPVPDGGSGEEAVIQPCPRCGKRLRLARKLHGRQVRCNACGTVMSVAVDPWVLTIVEESAAGAPASDAPPPSPAPPPMPAGPPPLSATGGPPPLSAAGGPPPLEPGPAGQLDMPSAPRQRTGLPVGVMVIAGAGLLVALLVGLLAATMLSGGGASSSLKYLPDGCDAVVSINVSAILGSKVYRRLEAEHSELIQQMLDGMKGELNLSSQDVARVTVAGKVSSDPEEPLVIVEFAKSIDQQALIEKVPVGDWQDEKQGDFTIHTTQAGGQPVSVCFPDDRTAIRGTPQEVKAVLARKGEPKLPELLQSCIDELDFSQAVAGAGLTTGQIPGARRAPPEAAMAVKVAQGMFDGVEAGTFQVDVGSGVTVSASLVCRDDKAAEKTKKLIDGLPVMLEQFVGMLGMDRGAPQQIPDEVRQVLDSLETTQTGPKVNAKIVISEELIDKAIEQIR